MSFQSILAFIESIFVAFVTDQAILEAGGTATTPAVQVGTLQGKPLYSWANLSTTKPA